MGRRKRKYNGKKKTISKEDKVALSVANVESPLGDGDMAKKKAKGLSPPVSIHIHSRRKREVDADGISAKAAIDGTVYKGLYEDDSPEFIQEVSYSQEKISTGEEEETYIEIYTEK